MGAPRQVMTTVWVDRVVSARDSAGLTEAALWCWAIADPAAAADFEQVLQVFGSTVVDIADPGQVHQATLGLLDASALQARDGRHGGDIADLAVDAPAVVFDVIGQWCRSTIASTEQS
ncbi:hypothetical protein [Rhodococcoides fascians]|uniref:hypothetical protein n=1 Tax=Rhodococcoides fascians TaxID=1828 RepID=UPI000560B3B1|nr:hypothetical protein [Rhodococcus fascians]